MTGVSSKKPNSPFTAVSAPVAESELTYNWYMCISMPLTVVGGAITHIPTDDCRVINSPSFITHWVVHLTTTHLHSASICIHTVIIGVSGISKANLSIVTNCVNFPSRACHIGSFRIRFGLPSMQRTPT